MTKFYTGFSTFKALDTGGKVFSTSGLETVKRDLLNHIQTIRGERPHRPDFGTRIPLLAFEPLDDQTLRVVREDLTEVFSEDPRVDLIDIAILPMPNNNTIVAIVDFKYLELNVQETLNVNIVVAG